MVISQMVYPPKRQTRQWEIPCRWAFSSMGKSPIIADTLSFQILICDPDSLTMAFSKALFVHNMLMGE